MRFLSLDKHGQVRICACRHHAYRVPEYGSGVDVLAGRLACAGGAEFE